MSALCAAARSASSDGASSRESRTGDRRVVKKREGRKLVKIVVLQGSPRRQSQTHRVAEIVVGKLSARGVDTDLISMRDLDMPLWSEAKGGKEATSGFWKETWPDVSARIAAADGFVVMTPEHHGMATPHLKNLLFCCENRELAFKPAYLMTTSGSIGGAHPVAELRISSYKNSYLHWLPDHLIIRDVGKFRPGEEGHDAPDWLEPRMDHGLQILAATAAAMKPVREGVVDLDLLRNGM